MRILVQNICQPNLSGPYQKCSLNIKIFLDFSLCINYIVIRVWASTVEVLLRLTTDLWVQCQYRLIIKHQLYIIKYQYSHFSWSYGIGGTEMKCIILSFNIQLVNQNQKMKKQCVISLLVYESDTKKIWFVFHTSILCWNKKKRVLFCFFLHILILVPYWILKDGMIHRLKCQTEFPSLDDRVDEDISLNSTMIVFQLIIKKTNVLLFHYINSWHFSTNSEKKALQIPHVGKFRSFNINMNHLCPFSRNHLIISLWYWNQINFGILFRSLNYTY